MKILFTGGGTGGHFYPIIAVAQELRDVIYERKLIGTKFYFMSDHPYSEKLLRDNEIIFVNTPSGKWRRYFSLKNFTDIFVLMYGTIIALWRLFAIYPDVIFSKGGYASMPAAIAARILGIPFFIHESDSRPGRANLWAGKFAVRIALSYPDAAKYFKSDKTAVIGNPMRREIMRPIPEGAKIFL
ncbi:MAG: glycosyltransferase, partial [Patescibacteria group bacterium]